MMKRVVKLFVITLLCFFIGFNVVNADTFTTLKEMKEDLAKQEANKDSVIKRQKEMKNKIDSIQGEISSITKEIEDCNLKIEESKQKIEELSVEIDEKNKEIESLLSFKQVAEGDNVYLEYIFGASSFTDFIYRSALVEQLTEYNDELIDEMYDLIEENKQLQLDLADKIKESEEKSQELNKKLKSYNITMDDLDGEEKDIEAELKGTRLTVQTFEKMYKEKNCSETQTIMECVGYPYATDFIRPIKKGSVTSNFGRRFHPTLGYYRQHNGIDLGVAQGSNVYSAALGIVSKITVKSSCGGNMVWIQHTVNGKKFLTVYQHLLSINVKVGDIVTAYDVIGLSGGGGKTLKKNGGWDTCSTGAHLHFGIMVGWKNGYYVDPRNYINFPAKGGGYFYSRQ